MAFINRIPHINVPDIARGGGITTGQQLPSPDGQLYATIPRFPVGQHVQLVQPNGAVVAELYKDSWIPFVLGWAHDGSGVYVSYVNSATPLPASQRVVLLYKLRPATPEEEREALLWRIGGWVGGVGLVAGSGWWLWQRRRRRVAAARASAR